MIHSSSTPRRSVNMRIPDDDQIREIKQAAVDVIEKQDSNAGTTWP